jgi:hypothetical protein
MHVENELVEFITAGDQEYEEIIEEYEEEILVSEEILEPSLTDLTNTPSAQGNPRCNPRYIYIYVVHYVVGIL